MRQPYAFSIRSMLSQVNMYFVTRLLAVGVYVSPTQEASKRLGSALQARSTNKLTPALADLQLKQSSASAVQSNLLHIRPTNSGSRSTAQHPRNCTDL